MTSSFSNLSLAEPLARAVAEMGYESMTPIQAEAIPVVMTGQDVMGAAQTGTGKTAAFSLPLLHRLLKHENSSTSPARHPVRALVLLPTRELADQVAQQVKLYAKYTNLRSAVVFGGMDMKPQTLELKRGVEVLVATPGRLLDHIEAKNAVLNQVEYVVLDEADRMLDIGFLPDLQRILSYLPKQRQTLLFSATFSPEIKRLAQSYLQDPITVEVARPNATATNVEQRFYSVVDDDKRAVVRQLLRALTDSGYTSMTPIQAKAIPIVLDGRDVMGAAQTGTGKTAAFTLPLLQKMLRHETASVSPARHPVRALVLAPTRELADQVANNVKTYAKHTQLRSTVVFGGIDMKPQTAELKRGVEVLIATMTSS